MYTFLIMKLFIKVIIECYNIKLLHSNSVWSQHMSQVYMFGKWLKGVLILLYVPSSMLYMDLCFLENCDFKFAVMSYC